MSRGSQYLNVTDERLAVAIPRSARHRVLKTNRSV